MITLVVMNKVDTKVTGDATVGVQFLADQCKASGVASIWVGEISRHFQASC